ncbi:hypothetical protein A3K73_03955 [Candidatus Pacearchaeota archaeon RBG_13_36_9]|nr:MAG: hypothetical protein A3K73_03955 [Candidatus Pacearchaeota archaeon RBG_13_36_9]
MARCFRCEREAKEVKLSDALYENDLVKVCERCAITENIPVLRKPSTSQLKAAERSQGVYERLRRLSGNWEPEKVSKSMLSEIRKLDEHPELEKPDSSPFNLIRNFHWHVMRARRNRGMSLSHLARAIGESESALKMVEKGELPEESEKLIKKLEQFFQIRIREVDEEELERERRKKQASLAPSSEIVSEPIKPILEEELEEGDLVQMRAEELQEEKEKRPARVLKFKPELMDNITIADLKKIKDEKEQEERLERIEQGEAEQKEFRNKVGQEMKNLALGGVESMEEKRAMLNRAIRGIGEEKKEEKVPSIAELAEKKKDKEKTALEKEKMEARMLEKKSEQEQIKQVLRGKPGEQAKKEEKPIEIEEEVIREADFQKLSELSEKKPPESLLGDEIEVIEDG